MISVPLIVLGGYALIKYSYFFFRKLLSLAPSLHFRPLSSRWPIDGPETDWERGQRLAGERDSRIRFLADILGGHFFSAEDSDLESLTSPSRFGVGSGGGGGEYFELQGLGGGNPNISAPKGAMVRVGLGTPGDRFVPMMAGVETGDHIDEGGPSN